MDNFTFYNPVKILFGQGEVSHIAAEIPTGSKILMLYGGGSIKKNGVYEQIKQALSGFTLVEFGGIEPNPQLATLLKAIELARQEKIDFILAVGGGSVLDSGKFIAAAIPFKGDPWDLVAKQAPIEQVVALGCVLTLPATGSEMNDISVISNAATSQKIAMRHPLLFPRFSVLDPTFTFSLPPRQISNGVVDAFTHVIEQYLTYPVNAPIQDAFAEGILHTLVAEGPKTLAYPKDYDARANVMWAATMALNGLIRVGVPTDWATHTIGHQFTLLYGLDHAQTLAIVLPAVLTVQAYQKREKLLQYGANVWHISAGDPMQRITAAIDKTREFFESLGVVTHLSAYGIHAVDIDAIIQRLLDLQVFNLGEHKDMDATVVRGVLELCK